MYPVSSQKKSWTFSDENEVDSLRRAANERFIERFGAGKTVCLCETYCYVLSLFI